MSIISATAIASPNIAFIKYWGNKDPSLRIPVNGSISMNLDGLFTSTQVTFDPSLLADRLILNDQPASIEATLRVSRILDLVRSMSKVKNYASVNSDNNFPTGAGIASSAAAFAALAVAASAATGLKMDEASLSRLARYGSGSACRSVPTGFVEWQPGTNDLDSYAVSIAEPEYWDLVDCVAVVHEGHKEVGSTEGHSLAHTSPLQSARVADASRRLELCRSAIHNRDFEAFAFVTELDSNLMHAVMMTSTPPLFYWAPSSLEIIKMVPRWRSAGYPVCYTLDAGPNVHVLCTGEYAQEVKTMLEQYPGISCVLVAKPGGPARLLKTNL